MPTPAFDSNGKPTRWPCADGVAVRGRPAAGVGEAETSGGGYAKRRRLEEDTPRTDEAVGACEPPVPLRKVKILSWTAHECIHIGAAVPLLQGAERGPAPGNDASTQEEQEEQASPPGEEERFDQARARLQQEPRGREAESEGKQFSAEGDGRQTSAEGDGRQLSAAREGSRLSEQGDECIHIGVAAPPLQGADRGPAPGIDGGLESGSAQEEQEEQASPPGEDSQERFDQARARLQQEPRGREAEGGGKQFSAEGDGGQISADGEGRQFSDEGEGRQLSAEGEGRQLSAEGEGRQLSVEGEGRQCSVEGEGKQFSAEGEGKQLSAERSKLSADRDVLVGAAAGTDGAATPSHVPQAPQLAATAHANINAACRGGKMS